MIYTENVKKAAVIALKAHGDSLDKGGMPYIFHPFYLAEQMYDEDSVITALLHDVIEDTCVTFDDLKSEGFSQNILDALESITKEKGEDYFDYIKRVSQNDTAKKVKIADLVHNMELSRLRTVDENAIKRKEKYKKAIEILSAVDNEK